MSKKILVTGAKGFIGKNLAERLLELGHEVTVIDDRDFRFPGESRVTLKEGIRCFDEDFFVSDVLSHESFDVVFHLAASINVDESIKYPSEYMHNNAIGTVYVMKKVFENNPQAKFIYASSAEVYGTARSEKMDENHITDPLSPYAVSKLSAEQMCKNFAQLYGYDITVIRNFNTFGEGQRGDFYGGVIAKFKRMAKEGKDLTVYGSGEQMRDYMHVSQAVDGYILAMNTKLPTIVNFGSGAPIRIIDIANHIAKVFNVGVVHTAPRPNEIVRLEADITRAMQYGYRMATDFWKNLDTYLQSDL